MRRPATVSEWIREHTARALASEPPRQLDGFSVCGRTIEFLVERNGCFALFVAIEKFRLRDTHNPVAIVRAAQDCLAVVRSSVGV
jgi:hypothetical protein